MFERSVHVGDSSADSRRQYALQYLQKFEYPVELRTLAAYVVAGIRNVPVGAVTDDERTRAAIGLHHVDIPRLVASGVVAYDAESRMVVRRGTANERKRYTDVSDDSRQSDAA